MIDVSSDSYSDVLSALEAALDWLRSHGISTAGCRYELYRKTIDKVDAKWRQGARTLEQLKLDAERMDTAFLETGQLIRIMKGIRGIEGEAVLARLRRIVDGPFLERDERPSSASNRARNDALELDILAAVLSGGAEAHSEEDVDLVIGTGGCRFFVECKRPTVTTRVRRSMDEAIRQLMPRLERTLLTSYGVIALSLGKVLWPAGSILRTRSIAELEDRLLRSLGDFDQRYLTRRLQAETRNGIGGALLHLPYVAYLEGQPLLTGLQLVLVTGYPKGTQQYADLGRLAARIAHPGG